MLKQIKRSFLTEIDDEPELIDLSEKYPLHNRKTDLEIVE